VTEPFEAPMKIQANTVATLLYQVEPAQEGDPAALLRGPFRMEVLVGGGRLPSELEAALAGLEEGQELEWEPSPDDWRPPLSGEPEYLPRDRIERVPGRPLEPGAVHHVLEDKALRPFRILKVEEDGVWADFASATPAGPAKLRFRVESVRWARLEEIKLERWRKVFH